MKQNLYTENINKKIFTFNFLYIQKERGYTIIMIFLTFF